MRYVLALTGRQNTNFYCNKLAHYSCHERENMVVPASNNG
eukprot:CAMPEP_0114314630 /NCGR_PEP_ID=MMETSP0059-20121206/21940_1 /TAXON_ID=36894 /ORGANISM="Pyramimonas parkeae, Strain CCMP726" /LENGTH=39 /DNA_ID= /DNA_START= /DNA_END= /DNA_ORIENTATION=